MYAQFYCSCIIRIHEYILQISQYKSMFTSPSKKHSKFLSEIYDDIKEIWIGNMKTATSIHRSGRRYIWNHLVCGLYVYRVRHAFPRTSISVAFLNKFRRKQGKEQGHERGGRIQWKQDQVLPLSSKGQALRGGDWFSASHIDPAKILLHRRPSWSRDQQCLGNSGNNLGSKAWQWIVAQATNPMRYRRSSDQPRTRSRIRRSLCIQPSSPPPPPTSCTGIPPFHPSPRSFPANIFFRMMQWKMSRCLLASPRI